MTKIQFKLDLFVKGVPCFKDQTSKGPVLQTNVVIVVIEVRLNHEGNKQ